MEILQGYRDPNRIKAVIRSIKERPTKGKVWNLMEVCGGQTHSIVRSGLDRILKDQINFIHGPGCPVCVTPLASIDLACFFAREPKTILCSYGDMLRVPGSETSLLRLKSEGFDIRMIYSPMDALKLALEHPNHRVIFFAIGFETTAPTHAFSVLRAKELGLKNFAILCSHMLAPPAVSYILSKEGHHIDALLAPGHVCTVMGLSEYQKLSNLFQIPIAAAGFESLEILEAINLLLDSLITKKPGLMNAYQRSVSYEGNKKAMQLIRTVFQTCDQHWRGIGSIERSGLEIKSAYEQFDAAKRWGQTAKLSPKKSSQCISGQILLGAKKPYDCPSFGSSCTPDKPIGATMVSSEGACAAYFDYRHEEL